MEVQSKKGLARLVSDSDILSMGYKEVTEPGEYSLKGNTNLNNKNDFIKNRYVIGGMYDPTIFGLLNSCKCFRTQVLPGEPPKTCPTCNVTVYGTQEELSKVNGYYILPYPVVSPIKIDNLIEKLKNNDMYKLFGSGNRDYDKLHSICMASYDSKGRHDLADDTDPDTIGLNGLYAIPEFEKSINKLLVIPSTVYRPCYPKKNKQSGKIELNMSGDTDTGTRLSALLSYIKFIKTGDRLQNIYSPYDEAVLRFNFVWLMYCFYRGSQILSGGKTHEVRDLTRSTIESSIRATISPALDLKLNQIKVPRGLAYHAIDEDIINALVDMGYTRSNALSEVKGNTKLANEVFENIINNKTVCLLWRNPTLYKNSVLEVYPVLWDEPSISIPIELCKPMNADFDGDQVGVAFITDPKQYKFITQNMTTDKLYTYERSAEPMYLPEHEQVLGLYYATSKKESKDNKKSFKNMTEANEAYKKNEIEFDEIIRVNERIESYGRLRVSEILGFDISTVVGDNPIVKGNWGKLITIMNGKSNRVDRLSDLKDFAAECVTAHGIDFPFEDVFHIDNDKVEKIINSSDPIALKKSKFNDYTKNDVKSQLKSLPYSNLGDIVKAGARVKDPVLAEIYGPVLKIDKDGNSRIETQGLFRGVSESTFINRSLDNRKLQQLKKGQVPLSGYLTRQMVLANSSLIYDAKHESPDKTGIKLTATEALGRTTISGDIVRTPGDRVVLVRSCLNHNQKKVFKDEISIDYNIVDGSNISINFATSFSEFLTQKALELKHGTSGNSAFSGDSVIAENAGFATIEGKYLVVNRGVTQDRYYISPSTRVKCKSGSNVSRGQVILELNKPTPEGIALGELSELLGLSNTQEFEYLRKINKKCLCYSPIDGTSKFITKTSRSKGTYEALVISNGSESVELRLDDNFDEVIYKPEGSKYKKGERISTGIIDLVKYSSYVDRMEVFYKMKDQCKIIFPKENIRSEEYEIIFKSIEKSMSIGKIIKSNRGDGGTDLMERVYYGATNQALKSYFKDRDEYKLDSSMILSLLFPDDTDGIE